MQTTKLMLNCYKCVCKTKADYEKYFLRKVLRSNQGKFYPYALQEMKILVRMIDQYLNKENSKGNG